jgi:hypothetical protein
MGELVMGLFSGKKKTVVGTAVNRVIPDDSLPDSLRTGVTKAIFSDGQDNSIPEFMVDELVGSIGLRADRMYEFAKKGGYVHGLPSGQIRAATQGRAQVQAVLEQVEGAPVLIEYSMFGPPNNLHMGWMQLVSQQGYDPATNLLANLSAAKDTQVYLDDLVVVVPQTMVESFRPGALDQWGTPARGGETPERKNATGLYGSLRSHSPVYVDAAATEELIEVTYVWEEDVPYEMDGVTVVRRDIKKDSLRISLAGLGDDAADYFHTKYTVNGNVRYAMYRAGEGTYPTLDAVFETQHDELTGSYYPFAYFRFDKRSEIVDKTTAAYASSRKLVKYLGMDYDQVAEAIDENPDIADVQQAMVIMAVPANTQNPLEQRYLFDFFDAQYAGRGTQWKTPTQGKIAALQAADPNANRHTVVIQDKRFKMALSDAGLYKRRVAGSIGAIGSYTSGVATETVTERLVDYDTGVPYDQPRQIKYHFYRRQVSTGIYEEIQVADLQLLYHVLDGYAVTADEQDDILLIPLDRSITQDYTIPERERLYARSLHYVFNSVQVIKVKWYQTGIFQVIAAIVAVVIAVYTGQFQIIGAALAGSTTAVLTLVTNFLISVVVTEAFKLFAQAVGGELALAIAAIAAVYAGFTMLQSGSLAGAPWAKDLLLLATGLAKGVSAFYTEQMSKLMGEFSSFLDLRDEKQKELDEAMKLLENGNYLSPITIFGESPNEFYNRTVHSGNVGVLSIGAISKFVDTALRLPKLEDTLGEST